MHASNINHALYWVPEQPVSYSINFFSYSHNYTWSQFFRYFLNAKKQTNKKNCTALQCWCSQNFKLDAIYEVYDISLRAGVLLYPYDLNHCQIA